MAAANTEPQGTKRSAGLVVTADLIFSTKIAGTARAMGRDCHMVGSASAALDHVEQQRPSCVILDLSVSGLTPELMRQIVSAAGGAAVLAFGSHVDVTRLQAARDAGCREVLPRSRLAATLPQVIEQFWPLAANDRAP